MAPAKENWFALGRTPCPIQAESIHFICFLKEKEEQGAQASDPVMSSVDRCEDQVRDRGGNLSRMASLHTLPLGPQSVQNGLVGRRGSLGFGGRDREGLRVK